MRVQTHTHAFASQAFSFNNTNFKFSAENSFSTNFMNCSRPAGSRRSSFKENAHLCTLRHGTSFLWVKNIVDILNGGNLEVEHTFVSLIPKSHLNRLSMDWMAPPRL